MYKRSFTPDSWWNRPLAANAVVRTDSAAMIAAQAKWCHPPTLGNPTGAWAMPWSEAKRHDPVATIRDASGDTVQLAVDVTIGSMTGNDAAVVWRDLRRGIEVATFETVVPRHSDGTINVKQPIMCKDFAFYLTGSNGIARQAGGDVHNTGHRGIPPSAMALHPADCLAPIEHRLKTALGPPGDHPIPNYPMYGGESPRAGGIPEGLVLRLRDPEPGNIVQQAAHDYGFIVGDTGDDGTATVKTVQGGPYTQVILGALDGTTWDRWDVLASWH